VKEGEEAIDEEDYDGVDDEGFNTRRYYSDDEIFGGISEAELKEEKRYTELDAIMASKMEFLYSKDAFKSYLQSRLLAAPKRQETIIMKRDYLNTMLLNEDTMYINVLASERKEKNAESASQGFPKVFLMSDEELNWLFPTDWKKGDPLAYTWHTLALHFYFPKKHIIQRVRLETCIGAFPKAQRMNIISHIK